MWYNLNCIVTLRSVFINVKKGMNELGVWLAGKHTTLNMSAVCKCTCICFEIFQWY